MKKVLLSLSMLAAVMSANAQSVKVGVGIFDDFATTGNPTDNPGGEYSTPVDATNTAGIFWYTDADPNNVNDYVKTRANGVMTIDVTKGTAYSVVGCGFGDDNGDGAEGNPFYIDVTGNKTLSVNLKSTTAAGVIVAVQIVDINEVALEISGQNKENGEKKKYEANVTTTATNFTFNFADARAIDHSVGNNSPDFDNGYLCAAWPADCPQTLATNPFDYTKVTKINFLISGGAAYTGTITFDDLKLGSVNNVGLDTKSAAANIASTRVFPNPSTSAFTAEVSLKNAASTTIILSDLVGKQIATKSVDANGQANFETAGLSAGTYVVTYVVDGAPAKSELVVVK